MLTIWKRKASLRTATFPFQFPVLKPSDRHLSAPPTSHPHLYLDVVASHSTLSTFHPSQLLRLSSPSLSIRFPQTQWSSSPASSFLRSTLQPLGFLAYIWLPLLTSLFPYYTFWNHSRPFGLSCKISLLGGLLVPLLPMAFPP